MIKLMRRLMIEDRIPMAPFSSFITKAFDTGINILSKKKAKHRVGIRFNIFSITYKMIHILILTSVVICFILIFNDPVWY